MQLFFFNFIFYNINLFFLKTFKANIEFPSIDLTLQYKNLATTQKKRLDLKLLNLTGQITITLNQNKLKDNFNLDFSFDKTIEIKYKLDKEPVYELF